MSPDDYMSKAARAAASARLLLDAGAVDGACNRAYYVMFDAAHAALLWAGAQVSPAETKIHRGLIGALGKHLVRTGLLAADAGKSLNQVERIRLLADYTGEAVDADKARWAVEQAAAFLRTVKQSVGAGKPKSK